VGKTTLARTCPAAAGALYLDLENPADLEKLSDARGYLDARRGGLTIIDEVQRAPHLFQVLRGLIDERVLAGEPAGQFLLLGSASLDLLQQSSESLAGRIAYLDLMVDLLLVRRLPPYVANVRKRLVKSPKVYVRDSGLVHTLLRLDDLDDLLGHPVAGASWEGFVIETLLRAAPERTQASFYRTATGVEVDLVLELPGNRLWAIEIKRGPAPKVEPGLRQALDDLHPECAFLVYAGDERYPKGHGIEAIGLRGLAAELAGMAG